MRAILIDPFSKSVGAIDVKPGLAGIRKAVACEIVTAVPLADGSSEVVYLDDEGMLTSGQAHFALAGHPQPYAGKGLVLGTAGGGEDGPATTSVRDILCMVRWLEREAVGRFADDGGLDWFLISDGTAERIPMRPEGIDDED
jgi:hypothetical protein